MIHHALQHNVSLQREILQYKISINKVWDYLGEGCMWGGRGVLKYCLSATVTQSSVKITSSLLSTPELPRMTGKGSSHGPTNCSAPKNNMLSNADLGFTSWKTEKACAYRSKPVYGCSWTTVSQPGCENDRCRSAEGQRGENRAFAMVTATPASPEHEASMNQRLTLLSIRCPRAAQYSGIFATGMLQRTRCYHQGTIHTLHCQR